MKARCGLLVAPSEPTSTLWQRFVWPIGARPAAAPAASRRGRRHQRRRWSRTRRRLVLLTRHCRQPRLCAIGAPMARLAVDSASSSKYPVARVKIHQSCCSTSVRYWAARCQCLPEAVPTGNQHITTCSCMENLLLMNSTLMAITYANELIQRKSKPLFQGGTLGYRRYTSVAGNQVGQIMVILLIPAIREHKLGLHSADLCGAAAMAPPHQHPAELASARSGR